MTAHDMNEQIVHYLEDVHSLEQNSLAQLRTGVDTAGHPQLVEALRHHLTETEQHERLIRERLEAHGTSPSKLKDMAQKGGAMVSGALAKAAPDTTGKLAIQAYATEHAEIASYRMLRAVAERAGDQMTVQVAERILRDEESASHTLEGMLDEIARYDLQHVVAA